MSLSLTHSELRQRCLDTIARNPGLSQLAIREKVGGKTKAATDMLRSLIDEGIIVAQQGGMTGTAHLLYLKGKAPEIPTPVITASQTEEFNCSPLERQLKNEESKFDRLVRDYGELEPLVIASKERIAQLKARVEGQEVSCVN
jgi:hypothetical protein